MASLFDIDALREAVRGRLGEKRFAHTLGVEAAAERMGEIYMPERVPELRCAALLHDVTKNETMEKQLQYLEKFGIIIKDCFEKSPSLLHGVTGALIIPEEFPEYNTPDIVNAVRWHTTGRVGMTDFETVIYLADFIEEGREYPELVRLRHSFWEAPISEMSRGERLSHLYKTAATAVDNTISHLLEKGAYILPDSVDFRNYCLTLVREYYSKIK